MTDTTLGPAPSNPADDSIDLFDVAVRILTQWRTFLIVSFLFFVLCVVIIYSITPLFEATASILPQGKDDVSSLSTFFNTHSPGDVLIGLLSSRSVADDVIDRVDLIHVFKAKSREAARRSLEGASVFSSGKGTLVEIKVRHDNSDTAQRIANAYIDALQDQREGMLSHEAEMHDRFYEQQLSKEADALAAAEQDLKKTQESSGVVQPEAQTNIGLNAIGNVRAQISALQVQLASDRLGETDQNSHIKTLESQIAQLQAQEHAMESAGSGAGAGAAASAKQMPELNLEYARKAREVRYHEALFTSISNQYEAARLSEGYSGASFVVVDRAVAPEMKAWPPRTIMLLLSMVFSCLAGGIVVALRLVWRKLTADPIQVERLQVLRASFFRSR